MGGTRSCASETGGTQFIASAPPDNSPTKLNRASSGAIGTMPSSFSTRAISNRRARPAAAASADHVIGAQSGFVLPSFTKRKSSSVSE